MKKIMIILSLLLVVGCNKTEVKVEVSFNADNYNVYQPYKTPVSPSFVIENTLNNYDPSAVSNDLMMLSTNYFKVSNSYFQNGQYYEEEEIKKLLSLDKLNKLDETVYFTALHEQNYLASNGNIKGISLALVINPYQQTKNEAGIYSIQERIITEEFLNKAAEKLLHNARQIKELENKRIVIAIFYLNEPNKMFPGTFKYIGNSFDEEIKLTKVNYEYHLLTDDFVAKDDMNTHNMFESISTSLKTIDKGAMINGTGIYFEKEVQQIDIEISGNFIKSEVIYLSNLISKEIGLEANLKANIIVKIKSNKEVQAIINKRSNSLKTNVEILRGWFYEINRKRSTKSSWFSKDWCY